MGLFDSFKTSKDKPYKDEAINLIYELLFCDNLELYKSNTTQPETYPWSILFNYTSSVTELEKIISDKHLESRIKILAYNKLTNEGYKTDKKELMAVIVEVAMEEGLDVLASFEDGTARYINYSGKIIILESPDENSNILTKQLFTNSLNIIQQIGPWENPRKPHPVKGNARISFLVSDGIYFGEAPINVLFNEPLASPALSVATQLMQHLIKKSSN